MNFIDWKSLLWGSENWKIAIEVALRTSIMFFAIIVGLRILGKRGVKQLSVFELVVIVGLGSAAGDPMIYKEVGIISSLVVFVVIITLYSLITYLIGKNKKFENLVEGKPICFIKNGEFSIDNFKKENLGSDEFFAELRQKGISHLGQVRLAIEESSGEISVFFFEDQQVKYGLPVLPGSLDNPLTDIIQEGHYSCSYCGYTEHKTPIIASNCKICKKTHWIKSSNDRRVT